MAARGSVERLLELWQSETGPAARRACLGAAGSALTAAVLIGRTGAAWSRPLAALVLLIGVAPFAVSRMVARRRERDPRRALAITLVATQPEIGLAALRALGLCDRTDARPETGSPELARLHLARLLGRADHAPLLAHADRRAWLWSALGIALACAAFAAVAVDPFRMVEGLDVLAARHGVAPLAIDWTEDAATMAELPAYLDSPPRQLPSHFPAALPAGTVIAVRVLPRHRGRALVLSDGFREVPLSDDGHGGLRARWTVQRDATLRIFARFGQVRVPEPARLEVQAVPDRAPLVTLEGAPATHKLLDVPHLPVHWQAIDDHGLREVALVLRSGEREQRRPLSKPQGGARIDRGGIDLLAHDRFLQHSYLPVEVTVEALDNDPLTGPKWGKSEPIVLIPPAIGEVEALRRRALLKSRAALTDLLAGRVSAEAPADPRRWAQQQAEEQRRAFAALAATLKQDFGGLRVPGRVVAAARGQMERVDKTLAAARVPSPPALAKLREASETALLALDALIEALGDRDSRVAALKLSDVATQAAQAIAAGREPSERARAQRRLDAAMQVLQSGGRNLSELATLGADLGEIVHNGLGRIRRALAAGDRHHARLAAEDLAARLRQPDPSFGSSGSGRGGTESGTGSGEGQASDAEQAAAGLEQALEELRRDHAEQVQGVERALDEAANEQHQQAEKDKLDQLAQQARRAVEDLPEQSSDSTSARSAAAEGRQQAEGMASALERGALDEATESGKRALDALGQAKRRGAEQPEGGSERDAGDQAERAAGKLRDLVEEVKKTLEQQRKQASEAAGPSLDQAAKREKSLAERARSLREQSEASETPLPEPMLDKLRQAAEQMDEAARRLDRHRGDQGLDAERQAQRLLEMAEPEGEQDGDQRDAQSGDGDRMAQHADVPGQSADQTAERFRKRVTDGLGKKTPQRLKDAVRRYAEGLLK